MKKNNGGFDLYACNNGCMCEIVKEFPFSAAIKEYYNDGIVKNLSVFRYRKNDYFITWDFDFECRTESEAKKLSEQINEVLNKSCTAAAPKPSAVLTEKKRQRQEKSKQPASRGR